MFERLNDERAITARTFLKQEKSLKDPRIQELQKQLLAFKLGQEASVFDVPCNDGFYAFASSPPLERYLFEHQHELTIDSNTREIQILVQNQYRPWHSAKAIIATSPSPSTKPSRSLLNGREA